MPHAMDPASQAPTKPLLAVLGGARRQPVPIWLMRQAGRYLPEYRALRASAPDFLACCNDPDMAAEITLQPIARFGLDAAIVFSDILIVPHAMGQTVRFAAGEGPLLEPLDLAMFDRFAPEKAVEGNLPLFMTLAKVKAALGPDTALIGFAGAPFTLAAYMVDGRGGGEFPATRALMVEEPPMMDRLVAILAEAVAALLIAQIDAGAEAVQLFDSWAGLLDEPGFRRWSIAPARTIVEKIHAARPGVPVIGFPRGAGVGYGAYAEQTGVDAMQFDQGTDTAVMAGLQGRLPVQGNLDPEALLEGGVRLEREALAVLEALKDGPHVFNLGHGVIKETPPEHVAHLVEIVRGWRP
jgi:uroporphyrinogen decarboxylase